MRITTSTSTEACGTKSRCPAEPAHNAPSVRTVVTVHCSRKEVVRMLRRAGFREAAEEAMRELPDPVDIEHLVAWGSRHGITRELLISQMGGSP
jgi:hypothetical protein